jgi:PAS domain S-box-containing protein
VNIEVLDWYVMPKIHAAALRSDHRLHKSARARRTLPFRLFDTPSRTWQLAKLKRTTAMLSPLSGDEGATAAVAVPGDTPADAHAVPGPTAEAQIHDGFITALLDSLQVGVATFDNDGRPVLFNRMLRHMYGLGNDMYAAEAMTKVYGTLHHPDSTPMEGGALVIARALHGETVRDAEAVLHTADRPDRYLLTNAQPILDADGRQLGAVSTVLDVTQRQRSERLRECELQIARLLVTADTIGDASPHLVEAIGQALGWPYVSLMLVDPVADALRPVTHWNAPGLQLPDLLSRHVPRGRDEGGGPGHVWSTGEPVWISDLATSPYASAPAVRAFTDAATAQGLHTSAAVAIRDGEHVLGVLASLSDTVEHDQFLIIGMLTRIAEQIGHFVVRQGNAGLRAQLARAKDDFLTLAGHEMRTPLTSIAGYSSLLADEPGLSDEARRMVSVINRKSGDLQMIIDRLLELAGLETGYHAMHPQPTDLSAVVAAAADAADPPAGVLLHTDVPATLFVNADPHRLRQIIDELLGNAIKYNLNVEDIHLGVHDRDSGVVELTVTDAGLGIPAPEREQLFSRFYRADNARHSASKGAGLGLTLVRVLVEAHGGTITIDPDHQPGTRIVVRLPACTALSAQRTGAPAPTQNRSAALPARAGAPASARRYSDHSR